MKLPVSVFLAYFEFLPVEEAISRLAKAGFAHGELCYPHLAQLLEKESPEAAGKTLRQYADRYGYTIPQGHLSFEHGLCDDDILEHLKPELDAFIVAGIGKAVLHANGGKELSDEERYDRWVRNLRKLSEYVEGTGVTICLENLFTNHQCRTANQLKSLIKDAGGKNLGICLDTGHLHLCRANKTIEHTHREFILEAGDLLQALHIADNNGIADVHQMPFSARLGVDWKEVMQALRDVDYKGLFNLEILGECNAPMAIKEAKLSFIRTMCDYMLTDEFLTAY